MPLPVEIPASVVVPQPDFGRRRTVRGESNPLDKSTVISIFPKENLTENKWTIQPGEFKIGYGTYNNPFILIVGSSSYWQDINPDMPLVEIPIGSPQVARSIVNDFLNGYLGSDMGDATPGLFWIPGAVTIEELKNKYKHLLDNAKMKQDNWYKTLVKMADAFWARTGGNPISISDDMRLAAKELGLDREWIADFKALDMIRCVACGNMRNPSYPVCNHCRTIIDKAAYDKLNLKPAV